MIIARIGAVSTYSEKLLYFYSVYRASYQTNFNGHPPPFTTMGHRWARIESFPTRLPPVKVDWAVDTVVQPGPFWFIRRARSGMWLISGVGVEW